MARCALLRNYVGKCTCSLCACGSRAEISREEDRSIKQINIQKTTQMGGLFVSSSLTARTTLVLLCKTKTVCGVSTLSLAGLFYKM